MGKVNLNEYYFVLVSVLTGMQHSKGVVETSSKKVKFTIVKSEHFSYKDLFSGEEYRFGTDVYEEIGTLFINSRYYVLPLNTLLETDETYMSKGKLVRRLREPLIKLNGLLHSKDEDKILDREVIHDAFKKNKEKQKKKSIWRS